MSGFFGNINWQTNKKRGIDLTKSSAFTDDHEEITEVEIKKLKVTHFHNGVSIGEEIRTSASKKEALVIPRVVEEDWRIKRLRKKEEEGTLTEEEQARLALLMEASGELPGTNVTEIKAVNTDEPPEDPDYDKVGISDFGMAILRGYGFKEEEGIGKTNKKPIKMAAPIRRKNLGVGATPVEKKDGDKKTEAEEDTKTLEVGSKVRIEKGTYKTRYGTVEGLDPDNSSCIVKLAIAGKDRGSVKISEYSVCVVSKKEYEKKAKHLNDI